jgi:hypothetical protein
LYSILSLHNNGGNCCVWGWESVVERRKGDRGLI